MASCFPQEITSLVQEFKGSPVQQLVMAVCGTRDVNHPDYIANCDGQVANVDVRINNNRVRVTFSWLRDSVSLYSYKNVGERIYHPEDPVCAEACSELLDEYDDYPEEVHLKNDVPYVGSVCVVVRDFSALQLLPEATIAKYERARGEALPNHLKYDYHRAVEELFNNHKKCTICNVPGCHLMGLNKNGGFCSECAKTINYPACSVCGLSFGFMTEGKHVYCKEC